MDELGTRGEIRVEARLRNNVLWHAIFDKWDSVSEFCREHALFHQQSSIGGLLNLKDFPINKNTGEYRPICLKLAHIFRMLPEDLFPPKIYEIERTHAVLEIPISSLPEAKERLMRLVAPETPEDTTNRREFREHLNIVLATLTSRQEWVLRQRFGLTDEREVRTLGEIGRDFGVIAERIRQIEAKALRLLRHPSRSRHLEVFLDEV